MDALTANIPGMRSSRYLVVLSAVVAATSIGFATAARGTNPPPDVIPAPPVVPPSTTPPTPIGTVDPSDHVLKFSGAVDNPTPLPLVNSPAPLVCSLECQEFTFTSTGHLPFLVAVQSNVTAPDGTFNANDGFDLYVYDPSGKLAATGNGIGANGQAVSVANPSPGKYTIVVTFTYAEDQNASYSGEVRPMFGSSWQPLSCTQTTVNGQAGCYDLPVLEALPPYALAVSGLPPVASTPLGFPFPVSAPTQTSCYVDETVPIGSPSVGAVQHPALRCLRFTSDVRNIGAGPLEIRIPLVTAGSGGVSSAYVPGGCHAEQVLTPSTGAGVIRPAGDCLFHVQHAHFHYTDLLGYTLYSVIPSVIPGATSLGTIGAPVATSVKASFCLSDDDYFGFRSAKTNSTRDFVGQPGCNLPANVALNNSFIDEGIKPGWGDVYTWDTPGQYIDITNTPDGIYDLVEKTNPTGALLVAGRAQTCSLTQLKLTATSVSVVGTPSQVTCPTGS
jgi:hypothetical protein